MTDGLPPVNKRPYKTCSHLIDLKLDACVRCGMPTMDIWGNYILDVAGREMTKGERQAGDEIEITEEMIDAGAVEVIRFDWEREDEREAASRIYRIMATLDRRR